MTFRFREELARGQLDRRRARRDVDARRALGDRLGLDGSDRPPEHGHPPAPVHPLDRDRRHAHPGGIRLRLAHAPPRALLAARATDQPHPRDAEALRRAAGPRPRLLGTLGAARDAASAACFPRRGGHRRDRRLAGAAHEPERRAAQGRAGGGRRRRGAAAISAAGLPGGPVPPVRGPRGRAAPTPTTLEKTAAAVSRHEGVAGAAAPPSWRRGDAGLVEAFGTDDANSRRR